MIHSWRSTGQKRTVVWLHEPSKELLKYLRDMQDAIRYGLEIAYRDGTRNQRGKIPSPIQLRREIREWFYSRYDYARHHINPVCRTVVAMLRSYKKNHHGELRIPDVRKLAMRVDIGLFKLVGDMIRVTMQPNSYVWLPINARSRHYADYSTGRTSELLITDRKVCLTFVIVGANKPLGLKLAASDLNFRSVDTTTGVGSGGQPGRIESVKSESLRYIVETQRDFSRRRRALQVHVRNPQKRNKKLAETKGRQRNRIKDALHKLSSQHVKENPDASFVFENLRGIRNEAGEWKRSRKFRTSLNRWPYRLYQSMVEYKSRNKTLYVSPRGTSSECPVCGGRLEHPAWAVSRCDKCGVDYDRNRLASLAILCRGLRLCGQPFAVSAEASWRHLRNEYLYTGGSPAAARAGGTEHAASAPNGSVVREGTRF